MPKFLHAQFVVLQGESGKRSKGDHEKGAQASGFEKGLALLLIIIVASLSHIMLCNAVDCCSDKYYTGVELGALCYVFDQYTNFPIPHSEHPFFEEFLRRASFRLL